MRGLLVAFDGIDGCGKSTALDAVAAHMRGLGAPVVSTKLIGGCATSSTIREMLIGGASLDPLSEALLFHASQRETIEKVIRPALSRGCVVLCDRYEDTWRLYQGARAALVDKAAPLPALFHEINETCDYWIPASATLIFDVPVSVAESRKVSRGGKNKYDSYPVNYYEFLRDGFLKSASRGFNHVLIDATQCMTVVADSAIRVVEDLWVQYCAEGGY